MAGRQQRTGPDAGESKRFDWLWRGLVAHRLWWETGDLGTLLLLVVNVLTASEKH
jgi:hypothetical protein